MFTMSEYLNVEELHALTSSCRCAAQASWLQKKAIPHQIDAKRVIVSRQHVRDWLEGRTTPKSSGPNWGAMSRAKGY